MWIARKHKKDKFIQIVKSLKGQVCILRGARQVGKTSFILNVLKEITQYQQLYFNLSFKGMKSINGTKFYGRESFGYDEEAEQLLNNIAIQFGPLERLQKPIIVFIDEADRHPVSLEAIQKLAELSDKIKFIYTGSNLENVHVKNAATGRKLYFDLYPITFVEFLNAYQKEDELKYLKEFSLKNMIFSEHYHQSLNELFDLYLRLGGMPKILDTFIDKNNNVQDIPRVVSALAESIEQNVKAVLGEKSRLYEYEDVLRKIAISSKETLKFSRLQVQHAGRSEAKRLVNKTVGARVAHKIRLYDMEKDLSKYIIFDSGILNYLLNGSDLLNQKIISDYMAILYENIIGIELISQLPSRDDLIYWKSKRGAQIEYMLRSPAFLAIDVKTNRGDVRSLDSCAVFENELDYLVKVSREAPNLNKNHMAKIAALGESRKIPLIVLSHYLIGRLQELVQEDL